MASIDEIQEQIRALPASECAKLAEWFNELYWERWDSQLEEDAESGKLDFLIAEARQAKQEGTLQDL